MWNSIVQTIKGSNDHGTSQIFMDNDSDEHHDHCDESSSNERETFTTDKGKIDSLSLMIEKILNGKQIQPSHNHLNENEESTSTPESIEKCTPLDKESAESVPSCDDDEMKPLYCSNDEMKPLYCSNDNENDEQDHNNDDSMFSSEYNDESSPSFEDEEAAAMQFPEDKESPAFSAGNGDNRAARSHEYNRQPGLPFEGTKESFSSPDDDTYESFPEDNEDSAFLSGEDKKSASQSSPQHSEAIFLTEECEDTVYFPHDDEEYDDNEVEFLHEEYEEESVSNPEDEEDFVSSLEDEDEEEDEFVSSISTSYSDDRHFVNADDAMANVDGDVEEATEENDTFDNISIFTRDDIYRRENSMIDSLASTMEKGIGKRRHSDKLSPVASYENISREKSDVEVEEPATEKGESESSRVLSENKRKTDVKLPHTKDTHIPPHPSNSNSNTNSNSNSNTNSNTNTNSNSNTKSSNERKAHSNTLSIYLDDEASRNRVEKLTAVEGDETLSMIMESSLPSPTINLRDEIELAESYHEPKDEPGTKESELDESKWDANSTSTRAEEKEAVSEEDEGASSENDSTSTRTREKLAAAEAELQKRYGERTTSWTRERLAEVERRLALSRLRTSTRTREKIAAAEAELAMLNRSTTTKTKERLADVEAALKKERQKRMSTKTLEMFKKKQEALKMILKENSNVDVAFLVDCTGSMGKYIEKTKHNIDSIVDNIISTFQNKVRIAFVGYRDHSDGPMRIETLGFTEDVSEFKSFVARVKATGGADAPEDVFGGLEAAINLAWSSKNKIIFHIADSPQHGARFHNLCPSRDNHFKVEPRGLQVEDLLNNIKQMKLKYYFGKINSSTDKMIQEFKKIAGPSIIQVADMRNFNLLGMVVVDSITKTILGNLGKTMHTFKTTGFASCRSHLSGSTVAGEDVKILKHYSISEVDPDYAEMKTVKKVKWLECHIPPISELSDIKNQISAINHKWTTATVKKANDPFSEGEQRISYHGVRIYDSTSNIPNQDIVLKEFKHVGKGRDRREDYIGIMETQAIAAFMANAFNKISPSGSKEIQFLNVSVMQMCKSDGAPKYYNIEVLLPDYKKKFKKWNNNAGYVSDKIYSSTLDAFSHWTYDITDGFLIVVDLQGVDRDDRYVLTDPSINCKEPRFGLTNLGCIGIEMFFKYHSCGNVCQAMGLKKNKHMRSSTPARISAAITKLVGH